jgi:flagellar biogenesis protein FliO
MKKTAAIVLFAAALLSSAPAFSQSVPTNANVTNASTNNSTFLQEFYNTGNNNQTVTKTVSPFWSAVKVIFFTALFGFLAYFIVKLIVSKNKLPSTSDEKFVDVIMTKSLGYGNYVILLQLGPAFYLLSMSNEGVRLIERIEDKEVLDFIDLHKEDLRPKEKPFFDLLTVFPSMKKVDKLGFLKSQKDRLKKM